MAFEFLINSALDEQNKRYSDGKAPAFGDTICFICSENGTIYKGYNSVSPAGDVMHAELAAVNNMRMDGQTMVRAITVLDSCTCSTIIPCNGCLHMLLSIDYRNINTVISTPSGVIPITQFLGTTHTSSQGYSGITQNMNQGMSQNTPQYMNQGVSQNTSQYMNQGISRNMSQYVNQNRPGGPVYMNGSVQGYQGQSVMMNTPSMNTSRYMNARGASPVKSYTAGGQQKSNMLKNKLNNLLEDDEESDS